MSILEALILGIIQGLTEYLPVSSSGHLVLVRQILDVEISDPTLFDIVLHGATALSTIIFFRKQIIALVVNFFKKEDTEARKMVLFIILSAIPVIAIGLLVPKEIYNLEFLGGNTKLITVGFLLVLTGLLLISTYYAKTKDGKLNFLKVIVIGLSQAISVLPGISRSGSTISTALLLNVDKQKASFFSFLMVIPVILGANVLELKDYFEAQQSASITSDISLNALIVGFISAFLVGLLACKWMINLVNNGKLIYFAYYCFAVAIFVFGYSFF